MRLRVWIVASLIAFLPAVASATNVSGAISKNTTWSLSGSPYIVTGTVTVNANKTLTVAAGVTVKLNAGTSLIVLGTLSAVGTAASPILFTSSSVPPAPGNWGSIYFNSGSSNCHLSYATVEYGGSGGVAGINANAATPAMDHVTIRNMSGIGLNVTGATTTPSLTFSTVTANGGIGVYLDTGGGVTISDTSLTNNASWAMSAAPGTRVLGLTNMTVSGNASGTRDAVNYRGGTIAAAETWRAGVPWVLDTSSVSVSTTGNLTIAAGTTVKFGTNSGMDVSGVLTAVGTSTNPILLTTTATTPVAGSWGCVSFNAGSSASHLSYASILYAGKDSLCYTSTSTFSTNAAAVRVYAGTPAFDHLTLSSSGTSGFYVSGTTTTPAMSFVSVTNAVRNGFFLEANGGISIADSTLTGNGLWAITTDPGTRILALTNMTVSGNGGGSKDAIGHRGGSTTLAETWRAGMIWMINAAYSTSGTLTVSPGATVKAASGVSIVAGTLSAAGTAANPIVFTSSSPSPVPGSWYYLSVSGASQLSYSSVLYAGKSAGGSSSSALFAGGTSALDHVTVANSFWDGLEITSTANVSAAFTTLNGNSKSGIRVSGGSVNVNNSTVTNNGDWAIVVASMGQVNGLTNMTVSGNGGSPTRDAIKHLGGTMSASQTWAAGMPWVLEQVGFTVASGVTWTVQPGAVIKLTGNGMFVSGTLTALGTPTSPIVFTSAAATPAPGDWGTLRLDSGSSASRLSYVSVSYGFNGVFVNQSSPVFDHLIVASSLRQGIVVGDANPGPSISFATITNNLQSGLYADTSIFPVKNSSFLANGPSGFVNGETNSGIYNVTPSTSYPVTATGCYWGAASGPSGAGPGTGGAVSAKVVYEPWLIEAPTDVNYFTGFTVTNQTFNPGIGAQATVSFSSNLVGNWTASIVSSGNFTVRTFSGHGATGAFTWDGNDNAGQSLPGGTYLYTLATTADGGAVAARAQGRLIVDINNQLTLTNVVVNPLFFSPNGDGVQDTTLLTATTNYSTANWTVTVKNSGNSVVRTATGSGTAISFTWDGRNGSGVLQPDGVYTEAVVVTLGVAAASSTPIAVALDTTPPAVAITAPAAAAVLSNVYQNGNTNVTVSGSASDLNFSSWTLEYGSGANPASWTTLATGNAAVSNQQLATWATAALVNGTYTLRLRAADRAGNNSAPAFVTLSVGNFSVSQPAYQFSPAAGQSHTYTSAVPFALTETLVLKNRSGQVVRTLVNASRAAGTYADPWNGRNDGGQLLPDGPYFYVATVTDGTSTLVWDLSNQFLAGQGWNDGLTIAPYDPFNNQPMTFTYQFATPGVISIGFARSYPVNGGCIPPEFCLFTDEYQESGPHTIYWAGVDSTGALRSDVRMVGITSEWYKFAKNAVVVYGSKPQLSSITVTPKVFGPAVGTQAVSFDVTSYLNQPVDVSVSFLNQSSLSTLRTVTTPQHAPGHVVITWDGRADNGMLVAPGRYTVTVVVSDALGNQVRGQILTVIQY